jgi:hypothetical protein
MATTNGTLVTAFNQVEGSLTDTVFHRISLDAFAHASTPSHGRRSCLARDRVVVHLRGPRGRVRITRVAVFANHRRLHVRLIRHGRRIRIPLRGLPRGTVHVRLVIFRSNRHRDVDHRTYHVC